MSGVGVGGSGAGAHGRSPWRAALVVVAVVASVSGLVGAPASDASTPEDWTPAVGGGFRSVSPSRVLDTRRVGEGPCVEGTRTVSVPVVPVDAAGVVLNVTVTAAEGPGYVTVWAAGEARPGTSSVNFGKGRTVENTVVSGLGSGELAVFASGGCPQVIVDVVGWFEGGETARGGAFQVVSPSRVIDTRKAGQGPCISGSRTFAMPEVPDGAAGAVFNVTVTGAKAPGYVTVWAAGEERPGTSSVNFAAGQTVANGITSGVGDDGLAVFASGGCPHVIVDLVGWFTPEGPVLEGSYVSTPPSRVADTRRAGQGPCVTGARTFDVPGVPDGATGVVVNVTVTGAKGPGYVQVYADGAARPATSVLNFRKGQTVANGATVALGTDGISVYASGGCPHVIVDLVGYYTGQPEPHTGVVELSAGEIHTCALIDDGTVRCWGFGENGVLGDGAGASSAFPVPVVGVDDAVAVEAGWLASCALLADTTVTCWGWDFEGPLLDDDATQLATAVPGLSEVTQVSVGEVQACALLEDATVKCWGVRIGTSPGGPDSFEPFDIPGVTDVVEVSSGWFHSCARHVDGTITCWGFDGATNPVDGPVEVPEIDDAVSLLAGGDHTCAVRANRSVWCWGEIGDFVGDDRTLTVVEPVQIPALHDVEMLSGSANKCAVRTNGEVVCLGYGGLSGVLGADPYWEPAVVEGLDAVEQLGATWAHACALVEGGTVQCWGTGEGGVLGNSSDEESATPVTVIAGIAP